MAEVGTLLYTTLPLSMLKGTDMPEVSGGTDEEGMSWIELLGEM